MRNDAVSNLLALSFAGVIFLVLFAVMVLQTVDPAEVTVPGNHDAFASELYSEPVLAESSNCPARALDECWHTLGFQDSDGYLNLDMWDAIIDGVRSPSNDAINFSKGEMASLADGWFSFSPLNVSRDVTIAFFAKGGNCPFEADPAFSFQHYPYRGDVNSASEPYDPGVYCLKASNAACPPNSNGADCNGKRLQDFDPHVIMLNGDYTYEEGPQNDKKEFKFSQVEDWVNRGGNAALVILYESAGPSGFDQDFQDFVATAYPSYLGGLFDLTFPDNVNPQEGAMGDTALVAGDVWETEGAIAASRLGALPVQFVFTTQSYDEPIIENLISRAEGGFLSYGIRDDFNSANRIMVNPVNGNLVALSAWSAPSTY